MTLEVKYLDLAARRALVAGGSSGIGLSISEAFLELAPDSPDSPQVREILANVRSRSPMMN